MHGSFTPDSAEKFLELMREAGYETSALPTSDGLQNFSELGIHPGGAQGDVWSGNVADFGEVRGEYIENYDYTRCVRPNGTAYGTSGKCKKGTESDAYMPVHQHDKLKKSDSLFSIPQHTPLERALGKLRDLERRIKDSDYSPTDSELERYGKLKAALEGIQSKKEKKDRLIKLPRKSAMSLKSSLEKFTDNKSSSKRDFKDSLERTKEEIDRLKKGLNPLKRFFDDKDWVDAEKRTLSMLEKSYEKALKVYEGRYEFSEEEEEKIHDYTRCVRPNGTAYGTGGKCKQGVEEAKPTEATSEVKPKRSTKKMESEMTPDEKWERDRMKVYNSLKGMSREQLVSKYRQNSRLDLGSLKDMTIRDLKGAIVGSEHGNYSPSERREMREARVRSAQRRREGATSDHNEFDDSYDFTTCERPNGSRYGTGGQCRKGTPIGKEEHNALSQLQQMLPKGEKIVTSSGKVFGSETEKKKPSATPTAQEITSMNRDDLYDGKAAFKPGTEGHQAYKNEIERRHKLVDGLKKRGMSDEEIEKAVWNREAKKAGGREVDSEQIATAPVPLKPIKDPVPGILRSQAEVKGIIADRPEAPNAIRDEMGRPLKLSSDRLRALSQEDLETEWNRAKTTSRKDSLRKEIDRRDAEGKLGKLKSDLLETSNKIDEIVKGGGKVGLNDPLSKKLKEQAAAIAGLKKTMNFSEGETYDFTRCVRPDGSAYGTRGKCKKGTEAGAKEKEEPRTKGGRKRRKTAEVKAEAKAESRRAAGEKRSAGAARTRLFKEEVEKVREKMRGASPEEQNRLLQEASRKADERLRVTATPGMTAPSRGRTRTSASPDEARATWAKAEVAVKSAKANAAKVNKETKGDKSPGARDRRFAANQALDRAEMAALRAQDKFHAATKRQSKAAMTPEQRKEERAAGK